MAGHSYTVLRRRYAIDLLLLFDIATSSPAECTYSTSSNVPPHSKAAHEYESTHRPKVPSHASFFGLDYSDELSHPAIMT